MRTLPSVNDYCEKPRIAGTYENQMLYGMCAHAPRHSSVYHTTGKLIAIGRIYAASPQRKAGSAKIADEDIFIVLAQTLVDSDIDEMLDEIAFSDRLPSIETLSRVLDTRTQFAEKISNGISRWSDKTRNASWRPLNHISFASKYLHFHRPNAFPIYDSIVRAGLNCSGIKGSFQTYASFCKGFCEVTPNRKERWYPRSIDTYLLGLGRQHNKRTQEQPCGKCGAALKTRKAPI